MSKWWRGQIAYFLSSASTQADAAQFSKPSVFCGLTFRTDSS
jgi:hypothetical protein